MKYGNLQEARTAWEQDRAQLEAYGVTMRSVVGYLPENYRHNFDLAMDELAPMFGMAMDSLPALSTDPNSSVPAMLTTLIDPQVFQILFSPNKGAEIYGEVRKGSWVDETAMFPVVEATGEVSSYGDYNSNGRVGANTNWPQRQSYRYQTVKEYGELELDRAGLAKINWVSQMDISAATMMGKYENLTYFFGVSGLQNYGGVNDPNLSASLTPATKAAGGTAWIQSGVIKATANEIYSDFETVFIQLINQTAGLVNQESKMTLALSPKSRSALTATNSFNVNVSDLLKKNFPNLRIVDAMQYGALSSSNPQGIAAGELMQLIADDIEGQQTAYCSFSEKMRAHPVIRELSSFKQKVSGGTWGTIIRMPMGIASMVGI